MNLKRLSLPFLLAIVPLFTGCGDYNPPEFTSYPEVIYNPNPDAPLTGLVRFSSNEQVTTQIDIYDNGQLTGSMLYDSTYSAEQGLPVLGMRPNCHCAVVVSIIDKGGNTIQSDTLSFRPPSLPAAKDSFPDLTVYLPEPDLMEGQITLLSVRRSRKGDPKFGESYGLLLALNEVGEVVWYYLTDKRISDFEVLENGHIICLTHDYEMVEIDWQGNTIRTWYAAQRPQGPGEGTPVHTLAFHHEVDILPWGNFLILSVEQREIKNYYTSETDAEAPKGPEKVMGDVIIEVTPEGEIVWSWNAFEHLDPFRIGYETFSNYWPARGFPATRDWSHGNGLYYDERDSSIIASFRFQEALIKIDYHSRDIKWILGDSIGWKDEYKAKLLQPTGDIDWFYHQHAPSLNAAGQLLIFDNQNYQAMPFETPVAAGESFSRATVFEIHEEDRTVRQIWTSAEVEEDTWFTFAMGDADWVPESGEGNIIVSFGSGKMVKYFDPAYDSVNKPNASRVVEYTFEPAPRKVWEVIIEDESRDPANWAIYGHQRLYNWPGQ